MNLMNSTFIYTTKLSKYYLRIEISSLDQFENRVFNPLISDNKTREVELKIVKFSSSISYIIQPIKKNHIKTGKYPFTHIESFEY